MPTAHPKAGTVRMSADERRIDVARVALTEFAKGGLHGTSTEVIARQVGVSQPYLFRLYPNKKALFLAAAELAFERIVEVFERAVRDAGSPADPAAAQAVLAGTYTELIESDPELLTMQLQVFAAAQDEQIREAARRCWSRLEERVAELTGLPPDEAAVFTVNGMRCNVIAALGLPHERYFEHMQSACGGGPAGRPPGSP